MDALRAIWNPARDVWEHPTSIDLLSEHSAVFSETWPISGMTRSGRVYPLPTRVRRTNASVSSSSPGPLFRTPTASEAERGILTEEAADAPRARDNLSRQIRDRVKLLPTPDAYAAERGGARHPDERKAGGHSINLQDALMLLPTPRASEGEKGGPNQRGSKGDLTLSGTVPRLLPTPSTADHNGGHKNRSGDRQDELLLPGIIQDLASKPMLLPTPVASTNGNTPENHLRKKPGRSKVTDLQLIVENDLLSTGGRMPPPSDDGRLF